MKRTALFGSSWAGWFWNRANWRRMAQRGAFIAEHEAEKRAFIARLRQNGDTA